LRYEGAKAIQGAKVDSGDPKHGPLVNPGTYVFRLTLRDGDKQVSREARVEVLGDPRVKSSLADMDEQLKMALRVRDDITQLTETVNQLRAVRNQLKSQAALLKGDEKAQDYLKAGKELMAKLDRLEEKLHNPKAEVTYDILAMKGGAQLYSQLTFLYELLMEADGVPTQGFQEVYTEEASKLKRLREEWGTLTKVDVVRLNELARRLEIPNVVLPRPKKD
jgi:hypothetical protein